MSTPVYEDSGWGRSVWGWFWISTNRLGGNGEQISGGSCLTRVSLTRWKIATSLKDPARDYLHPTLRALPLKSSEQMENLLPSFLFMFFIVDSKQPR